MHPARKPADRVRPRIEERTEQPYLAIGREVRDGISEAVDGQFPALFNRLGERGIAPSGPPFIRTVVVDADGEPLELEIAVPVAEEARGDDLVRAGVLPAGRYLTHLHVGPFRSADRTDLGDARDALLGWADEQGITYGRSGERGYELACCAEHLRLGPESTDDHTRWETELAYLIVAD